jgi:hypothetical protein
MIQTVVKRDGRIVGFCEEKIMAAIKKAMTTTEHNVVVGLFAGCCGFVLKTPKKKSRGLSASEFIAMQTEKPIIEDINPEKVKDVLEEVEKILERYTSYQTETEQEEVNNRQSQHYNYDEAGETIPAQAQQDDSHHRRFGGYHQADYRVRRSGGGAEEIRGVVRHLCPLPCMARGSNGDSVSAKRRAKTAFGRRAREAKGTGTSGQWRGESLHPEHQRTRQGRKTLFDRTSGPDEWHHRERSTRYTY